MAPFQHRLYFLLVFVITFSFSSFVPEYLAAAKIKCDNYDTHTLYHSSSTANKTENNGYCQISIDGAAIPDNVRENKAGSFGSFCLKHRSEEPLNKLESKNVLAEFVPLLVGATIQDYDVDQSRKLPYEKKACKVAVEKEVFGSELHNIISKIAEDLAACINAAESEGAANEGNVECGRVNNQIFLKFDTEHGSHELRMPLQ